eukprot:TRINITY_DN4333_c0_g1_i5.p3 TRINITY_DN4333_c0_g1~~TRINITY_DN4333_c0_g1_i5.p3  ORF type:complete len:159 (-),score=21.26 TRINITY_DN4333_c0_g1_i5:148-624(-)
MSIPTANGGATAPSRFLATYSRTSPGCQPVSSPGSLSARGTRRPSFSGSGSGSAGSGGSGGATPRSCRSPVGLSPRPLGASIGGASSMYSSVPKMMRREASGGNPAQAPPLPGAALLPPTGPAAMPPPMPLLEGSASAETSPVKPSQDPERTVGFEPA